MEVMGLRDRSKKGIKMSDICFGIVIITLLYCTVVTLVIIYTPAIGDRVDSVIFIKTWLFAASLMLVSMVGLVESNQKEKEDSYKATIFGLLVESLPSQPLTIDSLPEMKLHEGRVILRYQELGEETTIYCGDPFSPEVIKKIRQDVKSKLAIKSARDNMASSQ